MNINYMIVKNEMPASAAEAPYIGRAIPNGVRNRALMVANLVAKNHVSETTVNAIIDAAIEETAEFCCAGRDVNWGAFKVIAKMHGSFPCEDSSFEDAALPANPPRVDVNAEATNDLRNLLADVIPTKISLAEALNAIKVSNIMDVTTQQFGVVIGTTNFLVLGNGITLDGENEYVKAYSKKTGALAGTATVVSVSKGQRATCKFQTSLADGDYTFEIATCGLAGATTPRIFRKNVRVVYVTPPTPHTLTKVSQEANPDNTIQFDTTMQVDVLGTNLNGFNASRGDTIKWELVENGVVTDTSDNTQDIVSTTATEIHFEGAGEEESALPFRGSLESSEEWYGKHGRVKVTINGVTKTVENIFFTNT